MFPVFIPKKKVVSAAKAKTKKGNCASYNDMVLNKVLKKPSKILVYGKGANNLVKKCHNKKAISDETKSTDALFIYHAFLSSGCCSIDSCDDIIKNIENDNSEILNYSGSYFILDDKTNLDAQKISEEYGVLCQSEEDMDIAVLNDEYTRYEFNPSESLKLQWENVLRHVKNLPTNSLFICDRYLFKRDNYYVKIDGEKIFRYDGVRNIVNIVNTLLPPKLLCDFHVTIITSPDEIGYYKNPMELEQLHDELKKHLSDSRVKISIITIADKAEYNDRLSHDRRIMSPYFLVEAFKGLNVIKYDTDNEGTNEAVYSQAVQTLHLFSSGINHSDSDTPYATIERFKEDFGKLKEYYENNADQRNKYCLMTSEGRTDLSNHKNHMLDAHFYQK